MRNNQMYMSSQAKSSLRKFREGKHHDCVSAESKCFEMNRYLRLQTTNWEKDETYSSVCLIETCLLMKLK